MRAPVVAVDPVVRTLWGRELLARGEQEMTGCRWEKPENPLLSSSRNMKNSSRSNLEGSMRAIGGALSSDLAEYIPLVFTARAGDHIVAGVAAEEPG